ncbi:N-acetylmuramoyl-L-alanine amidase family protein [Filimonas effusa]|nr:N-acetylmuramoyl-L-alanine amidase [Filimonas effusa]
MKQLVVMVMAWVICSSFHVSEPPVKHEFQRKPLQTIVIDPGHGGKDEGAPGKYSFEKNVALAISLKLQQRIAQEMPDINIVMTRTTDTYPSLYDRANLANQSKGDLFISIHCNSADPIRHRELTGYKTVTSYKGKGSKRRKVTSKVPQYKYWTEANPAKGTETYIWAAHKNEAKEVAMRENEALFMDSSSSKQMQDFDPDSPQKRILYSLKTRQYFDRSASLALTVEDEFIKVGRVSREARQRQVGIWVLQATAMPSILVETGYISNPEEEDYLNSEAGQNELVNALVNALKRYRFSLESHGAPSPNTPAPDSIPAAPAGN